MNIKEILERHSIWLSTGGAEGEKANLSGANLIGANLYKSNLSGANLSGANLYDANLYEADLYKANLSGANLYDANLIEANLYKANLSGATLYNANLIGANLYKANLSGANLYDANLYEANLENIQGKCILTFSAGKHFAYACDGRLRIGCKEMSIKEWMEQYERIGEAEGYNADQIRRYGDFIQYAAKEVL